ncbi:uncharacterized protein LOC121407607 [Lytechinus variegatus]|uniref:uncharacterized protein LOC121407607 n=1 Tax=Lytechinus variegatus TaxID=7654 RepID=UPI001BB20EC2|nr:uncharacterized protein LOC121407607 [Lytechinus variegatus]
MVEQLDQNSSTLTTQVFSEDAENISQDRLSLDPEIDPHDHQIGPDIGTRTSCGDRNHWITDLVPRRRISQETSAYRVVMYVMAATGLIVIYVPFLPRKHSAKTFFAMLYVLRNIFMNLLVVSALVGMIWLTLRVKKLHEWGLVLWPQRCKHCLNIICQIKFRDSTVAVEIDGFSQKLIPGSLSEELLDNITRVSNVTLNISYIFSGLALLSIPPIIMTNIICLNQHSPLNPTAQTNKELTMQLLVVLSQFIYLYILNFHFIPTFKDAHFVPVPKIWWSFVLLIQVAIWTSIQKLLRPFAILANGEHRTPYPCPMNSTLGEVLHGIGDISLTFTVELPVMLALLLIEMWSQILPEHVKSLMKDTNTCQSTIHIKSITRRSNWITLRNFTNRILNRRKLSKNLSELSPLFNDNIEMESVRSGNLGNRMCHDFTTSYHYNKTMRNEKEKVLSITLLLCVIYFGISNYLLAGENYPNGINIQWILQMMFFTPVLLVIIKQAKVTKKGNRNLSTRYDVRSVNTPSEKNNTMLLISLSGACLFDMFCFVSSLGNLVSGPGLLSHDEMVLNLVSVFSCVFGLLCKCIQSTFILKVEHQQLNDYQEMKWTSRCLLAVGMVNATQWLLDSLSHEEEWPVLSMFFEGNVGLVIGMIFVPFLHLYELHIAIMAYEIYQHKRGEKLCI